MNLKELWDKCLFCPICQTAGRSVGVSVGPDKAFRGATCIAQDMMLQIDTTFKWKTKHHIQYDVHWTNNTFDVKISDESDAEMDADKSLEEERVCQRINRTNAYFWLDANCHHCSRTSLHTSDMELFLKTRQIKGIGVEEEEVQLSKDYAVRMRPNEDKMVVHRRPEDGNFLSTLIMFWPKHPIPMVDLDFSNPATALERVKNLLVFS